MMRVFILFKRLLEEFDEKPVAYDGSGFITTSAAFIPYIKGCYDKRN